MQSKLILVSLLIAIAPSALAAPYQPVTTTPCLKPTTTTTKCTSSTTTSKCTTTTTSKKCTTTTTPSIEPYVLPTTTEPAPYVLPTTTPEAYYVETTTFANEPITITHRVTETQSAEPAPTVTVVPEIPPAPKMLYCAQQWFGTAPFCNGKCPSGWNVVRYQKGAARTCDANTLEKIVTRCDNTSKNGCWTGNKVLCEWCEWR